jgi:hypothetical protein
MNPEYLLTSKQKLNELLGIQVPNPPKSGSVIDFAIFHPFAL